ncbi:carbamoyl phosphate synthase small subunit [Pontibacillus yanchengensis]|uniref:Carbamoyl phosphate synthase small subunit n=1 Tax=Pontibacillus yanchengensis TaxID=462910 RepID=A0ACC7VI67_9BACI|nr:carbamoyl phosphate synthase small subunit [Pontibacillus yanchengensis]MYL54477.1 carbamoyl phosphate synthase small subunit [Pontibacillus yanchengensis]
MENQGYLLLENGDVFQGTLIGDASSCDGEVVFNTSMTGYQEITTDPSYAGQIIVFCYPLIGNYGVNDLDDESTSLFISGVVIGENCEAPSHFQSNNTFSSYLATKGVTGISGIDTRTLVKTIRDKGTKKGKIVKDIPENMQWETKSDEMLVSKVSVKEPITYSNEGPHIVLMDFGYKQSIVTYLQKQSCKVTIMPYDSTFEDIQQLNPDGVVISNGPGDPQSLQTYLPVIKKLSETYPILGICLGHQLLALAYGGSTAKLKFGHRGSNHPVKNIETGKVYITSQNHGYEVQAESMEGTPFITTYQNVNDGSLEGMKHHTLPVYSVQFHPEAHAGPNDTAFMFQQFVELVGEQSYATT